MKSWAHVALLASATVAFSSCGSDDPATSSPTAPGVGVVAEGCGLASQFGSGVVLAEPGQVVTVAHTIKGAESVTVIDHQGVEHPAEVTAFDKDSDLAVLRAATLDAPQLELAAFSTGTGSILTWSRDDGVQLTDIDIVEALSITIEDIYIDEVVERSGMEIRGDIDNGDSGGPVVDADGNVIGIIYASARGSDTVGFATDATEIDAVLARAAATGTGTADNGTCF